MALTWAERAAADPSLRAFVDAEIVRAGIDVQAARVEHERDQEAIKALRVEVESLRVEAEGSRRKVKR